MNDIKPTKNDKQILRIMADGGFIWLLWNKSIAYMFPNLCWRDKKTNENKIKRIQRLTLRKLAINDWIKPSGIVRLGADWTTASSFDISEKGKAIIQNAKN